MGNLRGFKLRKPLLLISKWLTRKIRPSSSSARYHRLSRDNPPPEPKPSSSKLLSWSRQLRFLRLRRPDGSGQENPDPVPKGQLAVYVGKNGGELNRVLVPVMYFKHRLFIELLREAEEEYGFEHQKGITLPCGFSEFERIRTRIRDCRRSWRRPRSSGSCCSPDRDDMWNLGT